MTTLQLSVPLEIKSIQAKQFTGYGSVFGNLDHGGDVVLPGAFSRSLKQHRKDGTMPLMYWMHKADQVPGVWVDMKEDKQGLEVQGELVDTTLGRDIHTLLEKKAVRGLSIGYRPVEIDWDKDGNRLLKQVDLFEVSIVSMAMNPLAKVEAMKARLSSDGEYVPTEREFEQLLRKSGCSRAVSRQLVAKLFDDLDLSSGTPDDRQWDAGTVDDEAKLAETLRGFNDRLYASLLKRF